MAIEHPIARSAVLLPGIAVAVAVAVQLGAAMQYVPNRHAFTWDPAKRAMLDVEAADALRTFSPLRYLFYVAGPETWPTLRLALAAPVHAVAGPGHALAVEHGVSIAFIAALFIALAFTARTLATTWVQAVALFAIAGGLLLGSDAVVVLGGMGMLDVPSAVLTLAAATAWIHSRDQRDQPLWPLALFANLLFHTRWQLGILFGAAVLLVELREAAPRAAIRATATALVRALKSPASLLLVFMLGLLGVAVWASTTGGAEMRVFGVRISVRDVHGPIGLAAFGAFVFIEVALWRGRRELAAAVAPRVRFVWTWLLTPMVVWLVLPGMRRMRVLTLTSFDYQSVDQPTGLAAKLAFYPGGAWRTWFTPEARWLAAAMLIASIAAAWKIPAVRRVLVPFAAVIAVEVLALLALSRNNFQERFVLNLAPLVAVAAAAWVLALARPLPVAALAVLTAAVALVPALPRWRTEPLTATLTKGFEPIAVGDSCREPARQLPLGGGMLLNRTGPQRFMLCALWVELVARERGAHVEVRTAEPGDGEVLLLDDGSQGPLEGRLDGRTAAGPPQTFGAVTATRYEARR